MRIGVDGRAFESPAGGVRRYVHELYTAIRTIAPDLEIVAIGGSPSANLPAGIDRKHAVSFPTNLGWMAASIPLAARTARLDVYHAPAYSAPLWGVHPQVVTIHDVSYERRPEWNAYKDDPFRRWFYRRSAYAADRIVTDSEFSRSEIVAAYGISKDRIDVVPLAASNAFTPGVFDAMAAPSGVRQPYALHVGDLHVRRNLTTALSAILAVRRAASSSSAIRLPSSDFRPPSSDVRPPSSDFRPPSSDFRPPSSDFRPPSSDFRLPSSDFRLPSSDFRLPSSDFGLSFVCAGIDRGTGAQLRAQAAAAGDPQALVLTGPVSEDALLNLYRGASMLLYPSRYEGFGLPVLEAMQCGVPVIAANASSIPELAGDAGILLDPLDVQAWVEAIEGLTQDSAARARWSDAGVRRAAAFSWPRTAAETLAVFRRCAGLREHAHS